MNVLKTCRVCGMTATNGGELQLFKKHSHHPRGRENICRGCHREAQRNRAGSSRINGKPVSAFRSLAEALRILVN